MDINVEMTKVLKEIIDKNILVHIQKIKDNNELYDSIEFMKYIESSYWYYQDYFLDDSSEKYPYYNFKEFIHLILSILLHDTFHDDVKFTEIYTINDEKIKILCSNYRKHMNSLPVCGCILLSSDKKSMIIVKSYGRNLWNFPRGKKLINETDEMCAIRETFEEIGYDATQNLKINNFLEINEKVKTIEDSKNKNIEINTGYKKTKLFIIENVDLKTIFKIHTIKEIQEIKWLDIKQIPMKRDQINKENRHLWPLTKFERALRNWINNNKTSENNYYKKSTDDYQNQKSDIYKNFKTCKKYKNNTKLLVKIIM